MLKKTALYGMLAAASLAVAAPALAQTVEIGRNGVRIVPQDNQRDHGQRDHGSDRMDRRDHRDDRRDARREISEHDAVRIAHRQGLRNVDSVRQNRDTYRVAGMDRRGHDIRVVIDRWSGEVISVH